jgi:hypothetical protein
MKVALLILAVAIGSSACKKTMDVNPKEPEVEVSDSIPLLKYSGTFNSGDYGKVLGEGRIYKQNKKYFLQLANFKSSSGPNLHVFLSKEKIPVHFYDLGPLKSFNEDHTYQIEENLDNNPYAYICVHCVDFNHLFGWAKL